jgi:hypothetical protein
MKKQALVNLQKRWMFLNDVKRWKLLISEPELFTDFIVQLDNDDTYITIRKPKNEFQEEFILDFDNYIGCYDGIFDIMKALNIRAEEV